jgi:hypothetical protein
VSASISGRASIIDDSAQGFKECGRAVNLVYHNQLASLTAKECVRVLEPPSIDRALKIQVNSVSFSPCGYLLGQGRLADLAWAEKNHARHVMETILDEWSNSACEHNYGRKCNA